MNHIDISYWYGDVISPSHCIAIDIVNEIESNCRRTFCHDNVVLSTVGMYELCRNDKFHNLGSINHLFKEVELAH